jgi:ABC-type transporter Mla subunit MlaD
LSDRLKAEQDERAKALKDLARQLDDTARTFEKKTSHLDDQLARGLRDMRQQLHEQNQRLSDDMRKQAEEILARVASESRALRNDKADRAALAALFTEMAMRLTEELHLPGSTDTARG